MTITRWEDIAEALARKQECYVFVAQMYKKIRYQPLRDEHCTACKAFLPAKP